MVLIYPELREVESRLHIETVLVSIPNGPKRNVSVIDITSESPNRVSEHLIVVKVCDVVGMW